MNYKLFGKTGLRVSELCLGTMTFGTEWGWGADKETSKKIFDCFANEGGNFIDTANRYTEGSSEKFVGEFIHSDRDHFVVATKYSLLDRKNDLNFVGNHRKNMIRSVEQSLKRLNVDCIDILYLHAWDFTTPIEEVLRGMNDLVSTGKIMYAAISDTPAWVVSQANTIADLRGWTRFNGLQVEHSLIQRTVERDLLPMAHSFDIAITAWAPLAGGALTGKYLLKKEDATRLKETSERLNARNQLIVAEVIKIAEEINASAAQVALRWMMQKPQVIIPVVGATKLAQIQDSIGATKMQLSADHVARLNEISKFELGFPHDFLQQQGVKDILFGGEEHKLSNHRL
ncbi:MAG: aldo/keto reductase [Bacteroidota bacterium]